MPNGNIRFFINDYKKTSVGELQIINPKNIAGAVIANGSSKIYLFYED